MARVVSGVEGFHDWDRWLDGQLWELTKGVDFTSSAFTFRNAARSAAARRGLALRSKVRGDRVYIRAVRDAAV